MSCLTSTHDVWERFLARVPSIPGWFDVAFLPILRGIHKVQRAKNVTGNLCEIGVYHGRSFIPIYLHSRREETVVGIDRFEDAYIIDEQGNTVIPNADEVIRHLEAVRDPSVELGAIHFVHGSSAAISELPHGPHRIVHIDGDHSYEGTRHDLALAEMAIAQGGVILIDDVWNPRWPDVIRAVIESLDDGIFVPVVIAHGKLVVCDPGDYRSLHDALIDVLKPKEAVTFCDHEVLYF